MALLPGPPGRPNVLHALGTLPMLLAMLIAGYVGDEPG